MTKWSEFMDEIAMEAKEEGPAAVGHLERLREMYSKLLAESLEEVR